MPTRVFAIAEFAKFARKSRLSDASLVEAIERVERELLDTDLGGGLLKLRVARLGERRSSGYRTLVAFKLNERAFFVLGYGKNDMDNISEGVERSLRRLGRALQSLSEDELATLIDEGALREIER